MPECEVCGEQVDKVYKCKNCGTRFCEDDGSVSEKLCIYCMEEDTGEEEKVDEEEDVEPEEDEDE
jgi:predicted nucleic acid binding AN1-type Zn finger protein